MTKRNWYLALTLVLAFEMACASSPPKTAFDAVGVTEIAVDASMKVYADLVVAGKVPVATQEKVKTAFAVYQTAMRDAKIAIDAWFSMGGPAATFPAAAVGKAISAAGAVQAEVK